MTLEKLTGSTADTYLEYIQRNLPEGVSMKVCNNLLFFLNIQIFIIPSNDCTGPTFPIIVMCNNEVFCKIIRVTGAGLGLRLSYLIFIKQKKNNK